MKRISPAWHWRERGFRKPGPKLRDGAAPLSEKFSVKRRTVRRVDVTQLVLCADDEARRLLLGVSQREREA